MSIKQLILENPSLEMSYEPIKKGISTHQTVIIVGKCYVNYEGRASSKLDAGERILILKNDGSALIHRPRDYSPVNWQPPGSLYKTWKNEKNLIVRIYRRKDHEVLEVTFDTIFLVSIFDLIDTSEFSLYATESDMQEAILYQPSLFEEGFRPITSEQKVEPGFIDILGVDKNGIMTVIEIKRVKASKKAVLQLKKYMDIIQPDKKHIVRAILIAPSLGRGAQELLSSLGYEFKSISPQTCSDIIKKKNRKKIIDYF